MEFMNMVYFGLAGGFSLVAFILAVTIIKLRRVVPTNEVHIVQSSKQTTSYGKDTGHGNTYYEWPSYLPFLGVTKTIMPTSVFDFKVDNYD